MGDASSAGRGAGRLLVGVMPAAGRATRIAPLPCSKELLPVGVHAEPEALRGRPKVVSQYLLEKMRAAGANRIFFVLRSGKWDIAEYYGNGAHLGLDCAYLLAAEPYGPAFTVAAAVPFLGDATVLFGFPDILIQPQDVYARLVARLDASGADIVLGLFRGRLEDPIDVVTTDASGRVTRLVTKEEKPARAEGDIGYMTAAWAPRFTAFLRQHTTRVAAAARSGAFGAAPEWPMGSTIAAAIEADLHVDSVLLEDAGFLDIGTPAGLAQAASFPGVHGAGR